MSALKSKLKLESKRPCIRGAVGKTGNVLSETLVSRLLYGCLFNMAVGPEILFCVSTEMTRFARKIFTGLSKNLAANLF